ncbi:uncharacterized protein LOC106462351 [Limulus polyphemus]|uniref:Uncharacterized protein LOC106462351 n=1 Tax=Limulus polyphemus TaxID=6850 RepID=A0ABM1B9T1_LIMPO|nr:uncharacterized protein LOC106462351 [Limulus polyphemus]
MNVGDGIMWGDGTLTDLDFADDIALIGKDRHNIQDMTRNLQEIGKKVGLRINATKTKTMTVGHNLDRAVTIEGSEIEDVQDFVYLGSKIVANGESDTDVQARLNRATEKIVELGHHVGRDGFDDFEAKEVVELLESHNTKLNEEELQELIQSRTNNKENEDKGMMASKPQLTRKSLDKGFQLAKEFGDLFFAEDSVI